MSVRPVTPQLLVEELFFAAYQPVEQCMEAGRMVVMYGVTKFVNDDEIAQMIGQRYQIQTQ